MGVGKNVHNNFEIYNYLNIKQNIYLIFCTQQEFQFFYTKDLLIP